MHLRQMLMNMKQSEKGKHPNTYISRFYCSCSVTVTQAFCQFLSQFSLPRGQVSIHSKYSAEVIKPCCCSFTHQIG